MNPFGLTIPRRFLAVLLGIALVFALALVGCGSAEEAMVDEWGTLPQVSSTTQLELRIDSLMNENRKLRDQVEAITGENRRLIARTAELETKVTEAMAAAQAAPQPTPAPVRAQAVTSTESNSGYEAALALYNQRNYQGAIDQFQALLNSGTAGKLAGNCHYWIGESYYGLGKYSEAVQSFREVIAQKGSSKLSYAYMMMGNCEALLGNKDAAREAYNRVVADFPSSPLAAKAQAKLRKL